MLVTIAILTLFSGINVKADSSTSYDGWSKYIHWRTSADDTNFASITAINNSVLDRRYLNIPLRVANYCNNFPGNTNGECPNSFKSEIGMIGLSNGSSSGIFDFDYSAFASKYYSTPINYVEMQFMNGSQSKITFASNQNTNKINKGYFNYNNDYDDYDQTHKQPIYYIDSTHQSYPNRFRLRSSISANNINRDNSDRTQPGFAPGNIIMYKMSYMLGPSNGNFGDGTWSNTQIEYDPYNWPNTYSTTYELPYLDVNRNARMWLEDENNYNDYDYNNKSWYLQNNHFGAMFDSLNNPGCYDVELCGNTNVFQGSNPMSVFLSTHGHTYYDKNTNGKYYKRTTLSNGLNGTNTVQWLTSDNHGLITLMKNGNQVTHLSTSTIIMAQPYNYVYDDNDTKYYATVWMLDFYFFGYIDSTYDFDEILVSFFLSNQLSTYGNIKQLDLIKPESQIAIIGQYNVGDELSQSLHTGISNTISQIPIIGPIIAIVLEILLFCFSFIYSFINLLSDLPGWIRGAVIVLFISIVVKIIYKIIRGG